MVDDEILSFLRISSIFSGLGDLGLHEVCSAARLHRIDAGEFFFLQGDPANSLYLLKEGSVKLLQLTPDGQQVLMRLIGPWTFFAVIALIENTVYPVTAQAAEPCQALVWSRLVMKPLIEKYPSIALNTMKMMAGQVHEYQDRLKELATERVERRLARALLRLAAQTGRKVNEGVLIDLPLSRQNLAEMTGTTLFTVSRILSQWENQGLIKSGREKIIICFPHGLVKIAEDLPPSGAGG